jgi:hypothetical protein
LKNNPPTFSSYSLLSFFSQTLHYFLYIFEHVLGFFDIIGSVEELGCVPPLGDSTDGTGDFGLGNLVGLEIYDGLKKRNKGDSGWANL